MNRFMVIAVLLLLPGCGEAPGGEQTDTRWRRAPWDSALIAEVVAMGRADQSVRQRAVALMQSGSRVDTAQVKRFVAAQDSVDRANTARLREILDRHGWPSEPMVGEAAAGAAFLIVQHATHDPAFQKEYLAFLEEEHQAGRVGGEPVALLTDRTRQADGRLQLYGTQMSLEDGRLVLDPIEAEDSVDRRRAALGLPPLAEYIEQVREAYGLRD